MFNGIWLVATEPLTVGKRDIKAGERFHISRVHSGALLVTRRATIAHPQPPPKARTPEPPAPQTPRRRRREKKAEDSEEREARIRRMHEQVREAEDRIKRTEMGQSPVTPPVDIPQAPAISDPAVFNPQVDVPEVTGETEPIDVPRRRYQRRDLEAEE